jgi:hypothetical protein
MFPSQLKTASLLTCDLTDDKRRNSVDSLSTVLLIDVFSVRRACYLIKRILWCQRFYSAIPIHDSFCTLENRYLRAPLS